MILDSVFITAYVIFITAKQQKYWLQSVRKVSNCIVKILWVHMRT